MFFIDASLDAHSNPVSQLVIHGLVQGFIERFVSKLVLTVGLTPDNGVFIAETVEPRLIVDIDAAKLDHTLGLRELRVNLDILLPSYRDHCVFDFLTEKQFFEGQVDDVGVSDDCVGHGMHRFEGVVPGNNEETDILIHEGLGQGEDSHTVI